eukprot:TRINITY_DN5409_c2_g2_i1.p1 TRINITY_DN5409_c2_g2~~TRINITY_DN5409_c2_g2_i1.p1  ORF type:complete len:758 (+),score=165.50 TRINITY_DN5409_c2_g2_i1:67-2274(+)
MAGNKRPSVAAMEEHLGGSASRFDGDAERGRTKKKSLSGWGQFKTVSWRVDAKKDFDEHTSVVLEEEGCWAKAQHEITSWAIPGIVGVATATSGAFIEKNVEWFGAWRLGYCTAPPWIWTTPENCKDNWVSYDSFDWPPFVPYFIFIAVCTAIAALSATLTWAFAPMSRGSGIPEIKTILGGFTFPEVLAGNTLVIKIIGLSMSVGAGLSCGKEGPLVHIACCWSNFFSKFFARYKNNEAKQRELLSCACASGVAVAFGAPLGGVLFSLEEASTLFPTRTMLRAFFGAAVAAITLAAWNPTGSGKLTMFNAPYTNPPSFREYPVIILMGIVGGVVGAIFVHYNMQISKARAPGTWFRSKCHIILEVATISFVTAITSYHLLWTRVLSNVTIRALFHMCDDPANTPDAEEWRHNYMLDLCDGEKARTDLHLSWLIFLTGFLRFVQMTFTFGTGAAAGLFIPSLLTGAALGRIVGNWMYFLHGGVGIHPGMYAMLGAAAVLGGVCRVTISLVVIMFELTGGLQLIVPFMVVCTLAKWVGDSFTIGIYDYIIVIRKYPYLHEPDEVLFNAKAKDVMDVSIDCLHPESGTVGGLIKFLESAKYGGYPLTQSPTDATLLGYIHTEQLRTYLKKQLQENAFVNDNTKVWFAKYVEGKKPTNVMDLSKLVDECVTVVVPETPAAQCQQMFRNLGIKLILVRQKAALVGMITKKAFITHLEELHHSDHANVAQGGLNEALLPK